MQREDKHRKRVVRRDRPGGKGKGPDDSSLLNLNGPSGEPLRGTRLDPTSFTKSLKLWASGFLETIPTEESGIQWRDLPDPLVREEGCETGPSTILRVPSLDWVPTKERVPKGIVPPGTHRSVSLTRNGRSM